MAKEVIPVYSRKTDKIPFRYVRDKIIIMDYSDVELQVDAQRKYS